MADPVRNYPGLLCIAERMAVMISGTDKKPWIFDFCILQNAFDLGQIMNVTIFWLDHAGPDCA